MNWYFLFLLKDEGRKNLVNDYVRHFKMLTASTSWRIRFAADHFLPLVPESTVHFAIIPSLLSTCEGLDSMVSWTSTTLETFEGVLHRSLHEFSKLRDIYEFPTQLSGRAGINTARLIHDLLDTLPTYGTYTLDLAVEEALFDELDPSDNIQLYGALLRIWAWNHASPQPLRASSAGDSSKFALWTSRLGTAGTRLCSQWMPMWRGGVMVGEGVPCGHFELQCRVPPAEVATLYSHAISDQDSMSTEDQEQHQFLWSSSIEVLDEFGFDSLPMHLMCPLILRLVTTSSSESKASKLLDCYRDDPKVALLLEVRIQETL